MDPNLIPREGDRRRWSRKVIVAHVIAAGGTNAEAGEAGDVTPRTVIRYMKDPEVIALVAQLRQAAVSEVTGRLSGLAVRALVGLGEAFDADRTADRLRAYDLVLSHHAKYQQLSHTDSKLDRILTAMDESSAGHGEVC